MENKDIIALAEKNNAESLKIAIVDRVATLLRKKEKAIREVASIENDIVRVSNAKTVDEVWGYSDCCVEVKRC